MIVARGLSTFWPIPPILYSIALAAVLLPAYPSFTSRNVGIISFNVWLIVTVTLLLINCIVWRGNINNPAPVYCDISTAITNATSIGYQSSMLCITRQLYYLSRANVILKTRNDKRRGLTIDLLILLGLPFLSFVGHGFTQGNRYSVTEDLGCWPTQVGSWVTIVLSAGFPLVLSLTSSVYGVLTLRNFFKRRRTFGDLLAASDTGMKRGLYIRLMIISGFDLIMAVPLYSYSLYNYCNSKYFGWVPWSVIKRNWYRIPYYNRFIVDSWGYRYRVWFILYMVGTFNLSVAFFLMFGLSEEPRNWYWSVYCQCHRILGLKPPKVPTDEEGSMPSWVNSIIRNPRITQTIPVFASTDQNTTGTQDAESNTTVPADGHQESSIKAANSPSLDLESIDLHKRE